MLDLRPGGFAHPLPPAWPAPVMRDAASARPGRQYFLSSWYGAALSPDDSAGQPAVNHASMIRPVMFEMERPSASALSLM